MVVRNSDEPEKKATMKSKTTTIKLSKKSKSAKKPKREVQVVQCASEHMREMGIGADGKKAKNNGGRNHRRFQREDDNDTNNGVLVDFQDAYQDVYKLGSTQFTGKQKKQHKEQEYKELTGREMEKEKVPWKIARGIKAKAMKREKRLLEEAKDAGLVLPTKKKEENKRYSKQNRRDTKLFGPAPSIGFMKKGTYSYRGDR